MAYIYIGAVHPYTVTSVQVGGDFLEKWGSVLSHLAMKEVFNSMIKFCRKKIYEEVKAIYKEPFRRQSRRVRIKG
jgi:Zn/Cd-binding protein ZinT